MLPAIQIADEAAAVFDERAVTQRLAGCIHRLPGATVNVWQGDGWRVLEQAYDLTEVYVSYIEVRASMPHTTIPIRCPKHDLYWLYILQGTMAIAMPHGRKTLVKTTENHYRMSYLPSGRYTCRFDEGRHRIFYVVHKPTALFREASPELDVQAEVIAAVKTRVATHVSSEPLSMRDGAGEIISRFLNAAGNTFLKRKRAVDHLSSALVFTACESAQAKGGLKEIKAEWAERMKAYIDACIEFGKDIDTQMLSMQFRISRSYTKHIFKTQTNQYPGAYIRRRKLEHAKAMIESGERPTEAARYVNWAYAHFSKAFRAAFGSSPKEHIGRKNLS